MSPRETILDLIEDLPETSIQTVITFLKFIKFNYEKEDDCFMELADKAEKEGEFIYLDDVVKEMGLSPDELRN